MTTARINVGIYEATHNGKQFEIERFSPSVWDVFEMVNGRRIWVQDFRTKRAAVEWIKEAALTPAHAAKGE